MKRAIYEQIMLYSTDSIAIKDLKGRYIEVNLHKANNWGCFPKKMIGKTDFDFMTTEEAEQARKDSLEVITTRQPIINRRRGAFRNGKQVWYSLSESPLHDDGGTLVGTFSISRNITQSVEDERKKVALSEQIMEMLKIVTHDLSSPLNSIGFDIALILNEKNYGQISDSVRHALKALHSKVLKQKGAILDYLHKFIILKDNQEIEKEMIDLRKDVIDEVLEELSELIVENKSTIDNSLGLIPHGAVMLMSSKVWLKITFRNLIQNSLKHGGEGCAISFGFKSLENFFLLNLYNNGPAVPAEEIAEIFEPFVQGKNVSKGNGLGIGLHTVKKMIRSLGGDMWYETTQSNHPNFIFTLPKNK